jgi:hypothetical protein
MALPEVIGIDTSITRVAGCFADHDGRNPRCDLTLAKPGKSLQIDYAGFIEIAWGDRVCNRPATWRDRSRPSSDVTMSEELFLACN